MQDVVRGLGEAERERLIGELQSALDKIKTLRGLLPICAACKKIRDDENYWQTVEAYLSRLYAKVGAMSRIDLADGTVTALTHGPRFDYDLTVAGDGRMVVLGEGDLVDAARRMSGRHVVNE